MIIIIIMEINISRAFVVFGALQTLYTVWISEKSRDSISQTLVLLETHRPYVATPVFGKMLILLNHNVNSKALRKGSVSKFSKL